MHLGNVPVHSLISGALAGSNWRAQQSDRVWRIGVLVGAERTCQQAIQQPQIIGSCAVAP